jgi:ABC-type molybdate transport system substrate-binding protein
LNKEIADIKEQTKASKAEKAPKGENAKATLKKLKLLEKKKKEDKVIGRQLMTLTRLEKEVKLSSTVTDKDVVTLLSNYRKLELYQQARS